MATDRKLRLSIDELHVETFETADEEMARRGTVGAHQAGDTSTGDYAGCPCDTAWNTCAGACAPSQPYTCPKPGACQGNETEYISCFQSCSWSEPGPVLYC